MEKDMMMRMSSTIVVSHLLQHDMSMIASSDSQLAICSQVCKTWRRTAVDGVVQHAMNGILAAINPARKETIPTSTTTTTRTSLLDRRGGSAGTASGRNENDYGTKSTSSVQNLLLTEMAKMMILSRIQNSRKPPPHDGGDDNKGIEEDANNHVNQHNNDDYYHHNNHQGLCCLAWFEPSGIQTTAIHVANAPGGRFGDEEGRREKYHKITKECCHEWRGYRTPFEVLRPFGYDDTFVTEVFIATLQEANIRGLLSKSESIWHETAGICKSGAVANYDHLPTFAVRGTTLARPEGYCLCLDEKYSLQHESRQNDETALHRSPLLSKNHRMPTAMNEVKTRFRSRMIDLLPTVVVQDDDDHHQRRGVQFRSADESHATRLITPFFKCGGVEGPVTMFLVADSDEEGCWVSGRNSRFEVGHRFIGHGEPHTVTLVGNYHDYDEEELDDDDDDDYDPPFQCLCPFQSDDPFRSKHLSFEAPSEDRIFRGCLTPAERTKVSCYCAVFDGNKSMIRINSMEETQRRVSRVGDSLHEIRYDPERNGLMVGSGLLNGISLGADHQFDHSLSNDLYGSDTVLYELAIFSGRMNMEDIQKMEHRLMQKHGIIAHS